MYSLIQKKKTNKILNQKNEQISAKNKIIEGKNKDITDSLNYAKLIQNAILPEENLLLKHFDSFVYYLPKDIVSGDFFWIKEVGNKLYFSVVDCTGHGVPGAFMSIIGFNSLNRIVEDLQLSKTGLILDKLNELVIHSISKQDKDGSSVRDGMDLSICCLDLERNVVEFSGANNPLYILRPTVIASAANTVIASEERTKQSAANDQITSLLTIVRNDTYELIEIKADKMAIGGTENSRNYQTHQVQLQQGDSIYLFSDGYADQFGGPKGKKFMYKRFKEVILSMQEYSMDIQKEILHKTLIGWKGNLDQIDDICVIGVKV
jgi:serine phosphatase RsbU (regulator of sigma subunit)